MTTLEQIIAGGNRGHAYAQNNKLRCADGFTVSVIAGQGTYCAPRPTLCHRESHPMQGNSRLNEVECSFPGPYTAVEVGYPSERPEPWSEWREHADGLDDDDYLSADVYSVVPADLVRALIAAHGGEA